MGQFKNATSLIRLLPADPAAGVGLQTITVPAGEAWRVVSYAVNLTASAAVANRYLMVTYRNVAGGMQLGKFLRMPITAQTAGLSWGFVGLIGMPADNTAMYYQTFRVNIPDIILPPLATIEVYVEGVQAADQISWVNGGILYEKFMVNA
ncbi:MAG: hypothetical protein WC716_16805 [Chitinophagaceae bacterium]|jgi:hypothetical protein